ncbi:molybdopterin molybdotransferase MoeA [Cereibacter azotoformans]|uniref:Molybdopterin molybdenumtransferase n=1 Tax=Cereibacter azotoformans TaxID=43057 RepID=A0A2T5JYV6_9RHOB|nr:gephyrin-like molybdotransferase Glp [Cereibacter azotoformans]AXQ94498.1 molybdopterin molybdenumtransferase MoeA [Cereibacter sphaeroides]MBO4170666.1 molybdopterin molybdotransferase MoeA [Cereibacter azotoformans]PTR15330.1 molybdopterin molybdochelatase [Cereibacter azotoformans]UIJ30047.1 molybdopterin molybdotransferase MoeA [Cereibacter azotoformans]
MIRVEEALERALALASPLPVEKVPLASASGRVMARPAVATRDQPPFDASAMDGYAVIGDPPAGATFAVVGEAAAGHGWQGGLEPGQAVRIFTGAPVPPEATRVVLQEDVTVEAGVIRLASAATGGAHIRPKGQDFRAGDSLSPRRLRPNDLALLAAMNIPEVTVTRRPVVALIATGDELVMPGEVPRPDQIIASNSFALKALVEAEGAEGRLLPIARDTEDELRTVLDLASDADLIVTIGGASVGDHDLVGKVAAEMGLERAFYKIAMRPGKPLMAGRLRDVPMLGLPGNPVSSIVCAHLFLLPMLRAMLGLPAGPAPMRRAELAVALPPNPARAHYMRARLTPREGLPLIEPFGSQDSALLRLLAQADALLVRPVDDPAREPGEAMDYISLNA